MGINRSYISEILINFSFCFWSVHISLLYLCLVGHNFVGVGVPEVHALCDMW
jgi:hypothetical protein